MATYYRTGVETYSIIGTADERNSLEGRIPDGSTYFAVDENMFYTFYDGTWYETLPEAARLYHDDVGTDTKPIKLVGGVATVVANELAEDSKVVHKTGAETINGNKTFTGETKVENSNIPTLKMVSGKATSTDGWKQLILFYDGAGSREQALIIGSSDSTSNSLDIAVYNPDHSSRKGVGIKAYADHCVLLTTPYYPVDGSSNPQALTANALVASGNLAVDPRIVHTTGNETVAGNKTFSNGVNAYPTGWHTISKSMTVGQYCVFARINPANLGPGHFHIADFVQSSNTSNCYGRLMFKADRTAPMPMWIYRKNVGSNSPLDVGSIVVLADASMVYLAWKKTATYGALVSREVMDINYGGPQSLGGASNIQYYAQADMTILDNLDGYTVYEVAE